MVRSSSIGMHCSDFLLLCSCTVGGMYKLRSAKMRKCENGQRIKCEIESAKWRCENMYKMRKIKMRKTI